MGRRWEVEGDQEKVEIGEDGERVVGKVRDRQRLSLVDFFVSTARMQTFRVYLKSN